jgi:hypothetical protein
VRAEKAVPLGWLQKPFSTTSLVAAARDARASCKPKNDLRKATGADPPDGALPVV